MHKNFRKPRELSPWSYLTDDKKGCWHLAHENIPQEYCQIFQEVGWWVLIGFLKFALMCLNQSKCTFFQCTSCCVLMWLYTVLCAHLTEWRIAGKYLIKILAGFWGMCKKECLWDLSVYERESSGWRTCGQSTKRCWIWWVKLPGVELRMRKIMRLLKKRAGRSVKGAGWGHAWKQHNEYSNFFVCWTQRSRIGQMIINSHLEDPAKKGMDGRETLCSESVNCLKSQTGVVLPT